MSRRVRVRDEARQRVAEACENCRKAHQKCDDSFPCHRCRQKGKECFKPSILSRDVSSSPGSDVTTGDLDRFRNLHTGAALDEQNHSDGSTGTWRTVTRLPDRVRLPRWQKASPEPGLSKVRSCSSLGKRYLAFIQGTFLKSGDRHLFVGSESIWSFLQAIRLPFNTSGYFTDHSTAFTENDKRWSIEKPPSPQLPSNNSIPAPLPESKHGRGLADVFFKSTNGLVDVLDRKRFADCLANPQHTSDDDLCLVYLVLSIGLSISNSTYYGSQASRLSTAQLYFETSKYFCDLDRQLETPPSHAVSVLCLTALYETTLSRWESAYHYIGMAARFANTRGLHHVSFGPEQTKDQALRRSRWQSLCILDVIVSTILGLPLSTNAILDPEQSLDAGHVGSHDEVPSEQQNAAILEICQRIGETRPTVYSEDAIGTEKAIMLLDRACKRDKQRLGSRLNPKRLLREEAVPLVNIDTLESFGVMLLTRPFFFFCIYKERAAWEADAPLKSLAEACVASAVRTIVVVHAHSLRSPETLTPIFLHFCFAAAVIILSNEYFGILNNVHYHRTMESIKHVFESNHSNDVHTESLVRIMDVFEDLVESCRGSQQASQPSSSRQDSAERSFDVPIAQESRSGTRRNAPTALRSAPQDSRASMALHAAAGGAPGHSTPDYPAWWPQQSPFTHTHHANNPDLQHPYQVSLGLGAHTSTNVHPTTTYAPYGQYPALAGPDQVSADAQSQLYSHEYHHPVRDQRHQR